MFSSLPFFYLKYPKLSFKVPAKLSFRKEGFPRNYKYLYSLHSRDKIKIPTAKFAKYAIH